MTDECELEQVAKRICSTNGFAYQHFIGAGAFKETYKVQDRTDFYALKIFKSNNPIERSEREIDTMKRLSCINIAKLLKVDSTIYNGVTYLYIVEEYLADGSLTDSLKHGPLSKEIVFSIGRCLINALNSTYMIRIVHRDIKPDNIMFRKKYDEAVLVDFGLVRDLSASSLTQSFFPRGPGTPLYSSPEQLNNQKALIDWRSDQFALGITLCQALFLEHPFESGSLAMTVERIASMNSCNTNINEKLIAVGLYPIIKMLEPYPINRYRTPATLLEDWNRIGGVFA